MAATTREVIHPIAAERQRSARVWRLGGDESRLRLTVPVGSGRALQAHLGGIAGRLRLPEGSGAAVLEVRAAAGSLDTGDPRRDRHLRSGVFLDASRFPDVCFRGRHMDPVGPRRFRVTGDLRVRGVERTVVFDAEYRLVGECGASVRVVGEFDRSMFGLQLSRTLERALRVDTRISFEALLHADGCGGGAAPSPCAA